MPYRGVAKVEGSRGFKRFIVNVALPIHRCIVQRHRKMTWQKVPICGGPDGVLAHSLISAEWPTAFKNPVASPRFGDATGQQYGSRNNEAMNSTAWANSRCR
jgi:hypothetical protein